MSGWQGVGWVDDEWVDWHNVGMMLELCWIMTRARIEREVALHAPWQVVVLSGLYENHYSPHQLPLDAPHRAPLFQKSMHQMPGTYAIVGWWGIYVLNLQDIRNYLGIATSSKAYMKLSCVYQNQWKPNINTYTRDQRS